MNFYFSYKLSHGFNYFVKLNEIIQQYCLLNTENFLAQNAFTLVNLDR